MVAQAKRRTWGAAMNTTDDRESLVLLMRGFQVSRVIRLAADLRIADRIPLDGARMANELATECSVLSEPLLRCLRALASFGIFRVSADGLVSHSPRSVFLRSDEGGSLYDAARFYTAPGSWRAWEALDEALHGRVPHEVAWRTSRFAYLSRHPDEARRFDEYMAHVPDHHHEAIAQAYDFSRCRLVIDVGGGSGETLRRILARHPATKAVVVDRPDVIEAIPAELLLHGRISAQAGDFFQQVPTGGDLYLLVRVLHDSSDSDCARILQACRKAMSPGARLLIGEQILEPDPARGSPASYLIDLQMMAMFGSARERMQAEFQDLLGAAGFNILRTISTASAVSIIEAEPV
jgi:hypothetical protein